MPKTIAAPLPHIGAEPRAREHTRSARQDSWSTQSTEARVSALEARWEETVPTLATSLDLSDMRAELRGVENRLTIWVGSAAAGLLLTLIGIVTTTHSRFDSVNARFDQVHMRIDSAVAELRTETRDSIAELRTEIRDSNARMEARFERIDERFEKMEAKSDARFEKMEARFEKLDAKFDAMMAELRSQRNDSR